MGNDAVSSKPKSYYYVLNAPNNDKATVNNADKPQSLTQTTTAATGTIYSHTHKPASELPKLPDNDNIIDNLDTAVIGNTSLIFENKCIGSISLVLNKQLDVVKDLHHQLNDLGKPNAQNAKKAAQLYLIFHHEVQTYNQHLKTQQSINQSLNINNNSIDLSNNDDLNNILTQFSNTYEQFIEFLPKINKHNAFKKIDSEIAKTSKVINNLKDNINNNLSRVSVNSEYKDYIKSTLAQISKLENLTQTNNIDKNLSNIDILSIQVRYALKLKDINYNLSKIENEKIDIKLPQIPKSYLALKGLRKLKEDINNQSNEYFNLNKDLKEKLLQDIQISISFQKGNFSIRQNLFIPSLENPQEISQKIIIPNSLFDNKDVKFIRSMKNFSLPDNNLWQKFDSNTQKVDLQNTKIIFHKQNGNYCGIASLKNYFQTSSFKSCIDILSKRYDSTSYKVLKNNLNNIISRNDINPEIAVAISIIVNKLQNIKLNNGIFNQDSFNITQEEFESYNDIYKQLFNVDNAKDLTAKIINYIKPSYDILRSFSEDVKGAGIDLSKASEIFNRYSISSNGKINGSTHIPVSRFLNRNIIYYKIVNAKQKNQIAEILKNIPLNSSLGNEDLEEIKKIIENNDEDFISRIKKYHQDLNAQETEDLIKENGVILSGHNNEGDYSQGHYICIQKQQDGDNYYLMNSLKGSAEKFSNYEDAFQSGLNELSSYESRHIWVEDK